MFPSYEEAKAYEKEYNMIPVCKEIYADIVTPITLLRRLKEIDSRYYLLESVEGGKQWGQYSFLGVNPLLQISCKNGIVKWWKRQSTIFGKVTFFRVLFQEGLRQITKAV